MRHSIWQGFTALTNDALGWYSPMPENEMRAKSLQGVFMVGAMSHIGRACILEGVFSLVGMRARHSKTDCG
ncbi:MAG: hypothetical protein G3M70_03070 [Candidatus Nitronauta litoralis]|uniref:Uncharacterized protein n=1 Tax=Candidatus Nitronauta litoralis TaxID=2705533 RepID=A0A7T0BTU7_9BACT|nr:MAG: hypothetical protein G3M70_03070 [Candidatus Nitronauta litoralis]